MRRGSGERYRRDLVGRVDGFDPNAEARPEDGQVFRCADAAAGPERVIPVFVRNEIGNAAVEAVN